MLEKEGKLRLEVLVLANWRACLATEAVGL